MKTFKLLSILFILTLASCSTVRVNADYDKKATFTNYKTYAYLKSGIDKVEISDLDKKRILYSIKMLIRIRHTKVKKDIY